MSERYESSNLLTALPSSFLEPLLSFTLMEDPEIRLLVLSILTSLIDRRHNATRLAAARSLPHLCMNYLESWRLWVNWGTFVLGCRSVLERTGATLWQEYVVHVVGGVRSSHSCRFPTA